MGYLEALLLSLLQGATEFLPVSSSGHLALANAMLEGGVDHADDVAFAVLVHVGTLLAIGLVFRQRVVELVRYGLFDAWPVWRREGAAGAWLVDTRGRMIVAIVVASVPTGVMGLLGRGWVEGMFERPDLVGWALCVTGLLLASTFLRRARAESGLGGGEAPELPFPFWVAAAIGVAQGLAITPGISRSGATITAALLLGLSRRTAGDFSFLIAIPAILGAMVLELGDLAGAQSAVPPAVGFVALVVSAASGWVFLKLLLRFVRGTDS